MNLGKPFIFIMRRFFFVVVVYYLRDYPTISIILLLHLQLIAMVFNHLVKPLKLESKNSHYLEVMNDGTIHAATCFVFCFTEWVSDPVARYKVGWMLVGAQGGALSISLTFLVITLMKSCINMLRRCKAKKNMKMAKNIQEK